MSLQAAAVCFPCIVSCLTQKALLDLLLRGRSRVERGVRGERGEAEMQCEVRGTGACRCSHAVFPSYRSNCN